MCKYDFLTLSINFVFQGSGSVILQRAADGTPVQWFVEEDAEIVSQV